MPGSSLLSALKTLLETGGLMVIASRGPPRT